MTTRNVRSTIKQAMKTASMCESATITGQEAKKIVAEAEKGYVSPGEAKAVGDLFDRGVKLAPGNFMTEMCPETPASTPVLTSEATMELNGFFFRHNLPLGANQGTFKDRALRALAGLDTGAALAQAPSLKDRFPVLLRDDRPVDGTKQTAWLDPKGATFYLQSEGYSRLAQGAFSNFYGPFDLDAGPTMHTLMVPEHPGDGDGMAQTKALPETGADDGPTMHTLMIPEHPGDDMSFTLAIPEHPAAE